MSILHGRHIGFFPEGLIHDFGQNLNFLLLFLFGLNRVSKSVW